MENVLLVFRWIAMVPGAIVGAIAIFAVFRIGNWIFLGTTTSLYLDSVSYACLGGAFVYVGTAIAPTHRHLVYLILTGVGLTLMAIILGLMVLSHQYYQLWLSICSVAGIGIAAYNLHEGNGPNLNA